ncbi:MAG: hypothetical protein ACYDEX_10170, partial [Mobilitalea sp.]
SISPFTLLEKYGASFDDNTKEKLIAQNIINQEGSISAEVLPALQILARADAYTRIRILGTSAPVDKVTYFKDGISCSVDSNQTDFTITYPAMSKEAGFVLEEFSGSSRFVNVPFQIVLAPDVAMTFLSLVDLSRANSFCTLGGKPSENAFTLQDILDKLKESSSYLWLINTLKKVIGESVISEKQCQSALQELINSKMVMEKTGRYALQQESLELANTLLIPNYVFHITSAHMISATEAMQSECYVIFCGMHDLLYLDLGEDGVTIETMSGSDLLNILLKTLTSPLIKLLDEN